MGPRSLRDGWTNTGSTSTSWVSCDSFDVETNLKIGRRENGYTEVFQWRTAARIEGSCSS